MSAGACTVSDSPRQRGLDLCWRKRTAGHIVSLSRVGSTLVDPYVDFLLRKELKEHKERHAPSESDASGASVSVAPPLGRAHAWHGGSVAHPIAIYKSIHTHTPHTCVCTFKHNIQMRQKDFSRQGLQHFLHQGLKCF